MPTVQFSVQPLSRRTVLTAACLIVLCIALFFWQLGSYSLFNTTEAKQAEIARQIWLRHDWVTPVYNGDLYFDKPILLHWLIALGFPLFGINEWAVRFPSAVAATALILATWLFGRCCANQRTALLAATILAVSPFTIALGRIGQHDMLLTCFMAIALYCWYRGYSTGKRWSYLGFFASLALAVLAKGPLALALAGLTIAIFLTCVGGWQKLIATMPLRAGILVFTGITLPWYILVIAANGWVFVDQFLVYNNVDRFVSANLNQVGAWYYYLPLLLIGFFPWLMLIPTVLMQASCWQWLRFDYWQQRSPRQQVGLFMAIWFVTVLIFMSAAATKLPWYVSPGVPPFAYLCAQAWETQRSSPNCWLKPGLWCISLLYGLLAIGLAPFLHLVLEPSLLQSIASTGIVWQWSWLCLIVAGVVWLSSRGDRLLWAWLSNLFAFVYIVLSFFYLVMPILDEQVLGGRLIPIAKALQQETCETCTSDAPIALGVVEPSLNFYSRLSYIKRFDDLSPVIAHAEFLTQMAQPQRLLLVTTDSALNWANLDLSYSQPAYVSDIYKLFIIHPMTGSAPDGLADHS
jgi:4-amino-4-deoxy-L-arabinose transferase-like glycosyltransferase